ncbi:MAG: hypothetical protein V2I24_15390 [Halieaceae bacterium]|nr:hypothetical protein [Halieaceae bacterium]
MSAQVSRGFRSYCGDALRFAAATSAVAALLLAIALLLAGGLSVELNFDLALARLDALWILLLVPLAAVLVTVVTAPLAWLLLRVGSAARRGN